MKAKKNLTLTFSVLIVSLLIFLQYAYAAKSIHLSKIVINPSTITLSGANQHSENLQTLAYYSDGRIVDITQSATYSSTNSSIAYVSKDVNSSVFIISGTKTGSTKITANYSNKNTSLTVTVSPSLTGITIAPQTATIDGLNTSGSILRVTANYSNNTTKDVTSIATYTSSDSSIVQVQNYKLVSGTKSGTAVVTISYDGYIGKCTVIVNPSTSGLNISPTFSAISGLNTTGETLSVIEIFSDQSVVDVSSKVTYSSSNSSIAYVKNGVITSGSSTGSATITASYDNISAICVVQVTAELKSINISPVSTNLELPNNTSQAISVTANYTDGTTSDVTGWTIFSSSNDTIATMYGNTVTSIGKEGAVTITASYGNKSVTCIVNIINAAQTTPSLAASSIVRKELEKKHGELSSLNVSTDGTIGSQVIVVAEFADGYTLDVSPKTMFNTSDGNVAYVSSNASEKKIICAGGKNGTTEITAIFGTERYPFNVSIN